MMDRVILGDGVLGGIDGGVAQTGANRTVNLLQTHLAAEQTVDDVKYTAASTIPMLHQTRPTAMPYGEAEAFWMVRLFAGSTAGSTFG